MCGIAGIIGRISDLNRDALVRMDAAMVHRGPDGHGAWESAKDERGFGVLLAHRRLAILDLAPTGAQPMVDPVTGDAIVFNGEIYNYTELREPMVSQGQRFDSTGDTAVLLRALALEGRAAVASLRGMFALAFWNSSRRELLLARDPLGIKPLYVARNRDKGAEWSVAFASEIRALLASGLLGTPRLNPTAVSSVVWNGFVVGPETAVAGVESMWPGRLTLFDASGNERVSEDFYTIHGGPRRAVGEEELAQVLEDGLRLHLASDVPLAVFLSGGVDSSAVANLARRAARTPIHTFTLAFREEEFNEGPIARQIAAAIGTEHREVVLGEEDFVEHLEGALDSLDQPTFDGLNSYYLSLAIRSAGFTVALAGTGGDELFGGYPTFRELPKLARWARRARFVPRELLAGMAALAVSGMGRRGSAIPPQTRWAKLPDMARRGDDLLGLYQLAYALFLPRFQSELLDTDFATPLADGLPPRMLERLLGETRGRSPLSAVSVMELRLFLAERLLRDNDAASMAASIEQRVPLVDQLLFRTVDGLRDGDRFAPLGKKAILRRVGLRGLDPKLFDRPKSGFVLPYDRWIRRGLKDRMDETLRDAAAVRKAGLNPATVARLWEAFLSGAPGVYWSRVWAVYVLVRWCHRHGVYR